jgi:hypothetical protein
VGRGTTVAAISHAIEYGMIPVGKRWPGVRCIVAATGPSLTDEVAEQCRIAHEKWTHRVIAVNDAYRLMPFADVLYACDQAWWDLHKGCPNFEGEKWTTSRNGKVMPHVEYGLRFVNGQYADGFSLDPKLIHYGKSSGFQAINLAILFGASQIILVGFDMHIRRGRHFFGNHPRPLNNQANFEEWVSIFDNAARALPDSIQILNATPGSALKGFKMVDLASVLSVERIREVA